MSTSPTTRTVTSKPSSMNSSANRQQCSTSRSPTSAASRPEEFTVTTRPTVALPTTAKRGCRPTTPQQMSHASRTARPLLDRSESETVAMVRSNNRASVDQPAPKHCEVSMSPGPVRATATRSTAIETDRRTSARPTMLYGDDTTPSRSRRRHRSHRRAVQELAPKGLSGELCKGRDLRVHV
jgi:hypothetical protein